MKILLIITIFFTGVVYPNTNHLIGNLDDNREHCDESDYLNNPFMVYVCEQIHKKIIQKATNSQERYYTTPDSNDIVNFNSLLGSYIDSDTIVVALLDSLGYTYTDILFSDFDDTLRIFHEDSTWEVGEPDYKKGWGIYIQNLHAEKDSIIIEVIATTRTSDAIVPNSGTTAPSAISTSTVDLLIAAEPCWALIE